MTQNPRNWCINAASRPANWENELRKSFVVDLFPKTWTSQQKAKQVICDWADRLLKHYCSFIAPLCTDWLSVLVFAETPAHAVSLTARTASFFHICVLSPTSRCGILRPSDTQLCFYLSRARTAYVRCHFYNIISVTSLKKEHKTSVCGSCITKKHVKWEWTSGRFTSILTLIWWEAASLTGYLAVVHHILVKGAQWKLLICCHLLDNEAELKCLHLHRDKK